MEGGKSNENDVKLLDTNLEWTGNPHLRITLAEIQCIGNLSGILLRLLQLGNHVQENFIYDGLKDSNSSVFCPFRFNDNNWPRLG